MKVKSLGKNITEVHIERDVILVSYETPVAVLRYGLEPLKTEKSWSVTTSRHINQWLSDNGSNPDHVRTAPQIYFDNLLKVNYNVKRELVDDVLEINN